MIVNRDEDMFFGEDGTGSFQDNYYARLRRIEAAGLIAAQSLRPSRTIHIDSIRMEKGGYEIYFSCGSTGDQSGVIEISPELVEQLCGDPKVEMVGQAT